RSNRDGGGKPPDGVAVAVLLGEPERAVRSCGNPGEAGTARRDRVFLKDAAGRDPADVVAAQLGEPQRAVWSRRYAYWQGIARWHSVFGGHHTAGGDPPNRVAALQGEPQRTIRPRGDAQRPRVDGVFANGAAGGDPPDLVASNLDEPQCIVRPHGDAGRIGIA